MSLRARRSLCLVICAATTALAGCIRSAADEDVVVLEAARGEREEWFTTTLGGRPAGYVQVVRGARADGGHVVRLLQYVRMRRGDVPVEMHAELSVEEDASGRFLGFRNEQRLSSSTVETSGRVVDGTLLIVDIGMDGVRHESRLAVPENAVGYHRAEQRLCALLAEEPDAAASRETLDVVFVPELRTFTTQRAVSGPIESIEVNGERRDLRRVTVTQDALPDFRMEQWFDGACVLHKYTVPLLDSALVFERSSRAAALALDRDRPPEVFESSSVPVAGRVVAHGDEATYRIRFKRPPAEGMDATAATFRQTGQEVLETIDDAVVIRVRKLAAPIGARRPAPTEVASELAEHLRANASIQSDDADVRAVADEVVSGETDAWKAATRLERWVFENIREKNLETAFASAKEVLATREGDCTEHGVLLAALARAAGIPARVVAGFLYHDGSFVGHLWTEVHVGRWVPLDATLGRGEVGADHIALSTASMEGFGGRFFLDLLKVLGNVEIEVLASR